MATIRIQNIYFTYSTTKRVKELNKGRIPIAFLKVELRHTVATDRYKVESLWYSTLLSKRIYPNKRTYPNKV